MSKLAPLRSTLIHQIRLYTRYAYTPDTLIHQTPQVNEKKRERKLRFYNLNNATALFNGVLCLLLVPFLITLYPYSLIYVYLYGARTLIRLYTRYAYTPDTLIHRYVYGKYFLRQTTRGIQVIRRYDNAS